MGDWSELTWVAPAWLWAALLLPVAWWIAERRRAPALPLPTVSLPDAVGAADWPTSARRALAWTPRALRGLGLVALLVALARPVRRDPVPPTVESIDVLVCLDTSSSMRAEDLAPGRTRLEIARAAAADFVRSRGGDRVGLLRFARYPDLVCPPTLDHAVLEELLAGIETVESDGSEDATGIGTAVARAAQALTSGGASRVVVLLTDGEENVARPERPDEIAPLHAAQLCAELGVRVHVISTAADVSAEGATAMRELATRTDGSYFVARDAAALRAVYAEIDALERSAVAEVQYRVEERFGGFAGIGIVLLAGAAVLGTTVFGGTE